MDNQNNKKTRIIEACILVLISVLPLVVFWSMAVEYYKRIFGQYNYSIENPVSDVTLLLFVIFALFVNCFILIRLIKYKKMNWYYPIGTILITLLILYGVIPVRINGNFCQSSDSKVQYVANSLQVYHSKNGSFPEPSNLEKDDFLLSLKRDYKIDYFVKDKPNQLFVYFNNCKLLVEPDEYFTYPRN